MTRMETIVALERLAQRHDARGNAESATSIRHHAQKYRRISDDDFEAMKARMLAIPPIPKPYLFDFGPDASI